VLSVQWETEAGNPKNICLEIFISTQHSFLPTAEKKWCPHKLLQILKFVFLTIFVFAVCLTAQEDDNFFDAVETDVFGLQSSMYKSEVQKKNGVYVAAIDSRDGSIHQFYR
jgi:hypothetical protein